MVEARIWSLRSPLSLGCSGSALPHCGCCSQVIYNTCNELKALENFVLLCPGMKESVAFPSDKVGKWWQQSWANRQLLLHSSAQPGRAEGQFSAGQVTSSAFIWAIFHIYGCAQHPGAEWGHSPPSCACLGAGLGPAAGGTFSPCWNIYCRE